MQDFYKVSISFGDKTGKSRSVILQESKEKIEFKIKKKGQMAKPIVKTIMPSQIELDNFSIILKNKRNKATVASLLDIQDLNNQKVQQNCQRIIKGIKDEQQAMQIFKIHHKIDNFVKKTGSTEKVAEKYLKKHKSFEEAAQVYKRHQNKIQQVMKNYGCDRQNAVSLLQGNNYQLPDI